MSHFHRHFLNGKAISPFHYIIGKLFGPKCRALTPLTRQEVTDMERFAGRKQHDAMPGLIPSMRVVGRYFAMAFITNHKHLPVVRGRLRTGAK